MRIGIGSDHAGFALKEDLRSWLTAMGHEVVDYGPDSGGVPANDYPLRAARVAGDVVQGTTGTGILLCGTGIGMSIAANKVPGARAALCHDAFQARMARAHNDANVLVLGARIISAELAREIVSAWLKTPYEAGRHVVRNAWLSVLEARYRAGGSDPQAQ